jgi:biopolymer transport protein ExbD
MEDGSSPAPAPTVATPSKASHGPADYKRADTSYYGRGDVLRAHSSAVILKTGEYMQSGDTYTFTPKTRAPKTVYLETVTDWVEPITPPDMPASLGVPPDEMQIREPQGDVQVALPSAPASFAPVTPNMTLPNGAVLKTGADGSVAVLFGGVDSARLMPNSSAAVQQTVTASTRSAEVDLTAGGVFSKVGTQVGVKGTYEVHTPNGNAIAEGGDFVTIIGDARTDVWVAAGTVNLNGTDGKKGPFATSDGVGPLKVMRLPVMTDPKASFAADTETLSAVLNFIPLANQKIGALRAKKNGGATLTANEEAYLARLKKVPCVIKLALVEPPAPAPIAVAPTPAPAVAPSVAPTPAAPMVKTVPPTKEPLNVNVHPDGTVGFRGVKLQPAAFQAKLAHIGKVSPTQAFVVHSSPDVPDDKLKAVMDSFQAANLANVSTGIPLAAEVKPVPPAPKPKPLVEKPVLAPLPPPEPAPVESTPTAATPMASTPSSTTSSTETSSAPAKAATTAVTDLSKPLKAVVRQDGKINFQKVTLTPAEFKTRINALMQSTPDQAVSVKAAKTVSYEFYETAVNICRAAQVKNLTTSGPSPQNEFPADNLPAPGLMLRPSPGPLPDNTTPPPTPSPTPAIPATP